MKPRLIGVATCKNCCRLKKIWEKQNIDFEYWDGDRDDLQKELDRMNINDFPVIQIIDNNQNILYTFDNVVYPKGVSYAKVKQKIEQLK